jgi:signal peptidase II
VISRLLSVKTLVLSIIVMTAVSLPIDQILKLEATRDFLITEDPTDTTIYQGRRQEIFGLDAGIFWITLTKTYVRNHGASWGLGANVDNRWRVTGMMVFSFVATMGLFYAAVRLRETGHLWSSFGLAGIIVGSFGNVVDRFRLGYVIDFLSLKGGIGSRSFVLPSFNAADIIIILSLILLITTIHTPGAEKVRGN